MRKSDSLKRRRLAEIRVNKVKAKVAVLNAMEEIERRVAEFGLTVRHTNAGTLHVMFDRADTGWRFADWYPATGTWYHPETGQKGIAWTIDDILSEVGFRALQIK